MPDLTPDQYQVLILSELGDPDVVLATQLPTLWALYADKDGLRRQRYLYTKRHAIDVLIGSLREQVSFSVAGDLSLQLNRKIDNLGLMRAAVETEIATNLRMARAPVAGVLTTTAPVPSPTGAPNANSIGYKGDPNNPIPGVQPWR